MVINVNFKIFFASGGGAGPRSGRGAKSPKTPFHTCAHFCYTFSDPESLSSATI